MLNTSKPKKVLQIIFGLRIGGNQRVAINLAKAFEYFGWEQYLLVRFPKIEYSVDNLKNIVILDGTDEKFYTWYNQNKPFDLVISHNGHHANQLLNCDMYCYIHTTLSLRMRNKNIFQKYLAKKEIKKLYDNKKIIAISDGIADDIQQLGINAASITRVNNPFDVDDLYKESQVYIPDIKGNYIIHIGSFNGVKRHDILLKAFAKTQCSHTLVLIGKGSRECNTKKLAHKLGIASRVMFVGYVQNPYPWLRNAQLLVLSSDAEGVPNVVVEALLLYTPVVTTDCCAAVHDFMACQQRQYIVPIRSPTLLAQAIENCLNNPPTINVQAVSEKVSMKTAIEAFEALVES